LKITSKQCNVAVLQHTQHNTHLCQIHVFKGGVYTFVSHLCVRCFMTEEWSMQLLVLRQRYLQHRAHVH